MALVEERFVAFSVGKFNVMMRDFVVLKRSHSVAFLKVDFFRATTFSRYHILRSNVLNALVSDGFPDV